MMKKVILLEVKQKGSNFYLFSYDPRKVINLVKIVEHSTTQEHQRPWKESRVKDIAKYISGKENLDFSKNRVAKKAKGILPNCPILNIKGNLNIVTENGQKYLLFPDKEEEFENCKGSIEILDGQHRLISFSDEYAGKVGFEDTEYTMGYVLFNHLKLDEKKEIFIVANEKQEKVEKNILRHLMRYLGILSEDEVETDMLVEILNAEKESPIAHRVSVEGEKIPRGFKLIQISKILQNSGVMSNLGKRNINQKAKILITYLGAWNNLYDGALKDSNHTLGKISGLRYVLYLFPFISDILEKNKMDGSSENIKKILQLIKEKKLQPEIFNSDSEEALLFRAETSTIALARKHGDYLRDTYVNQEEHFDPFSVI